MLRQKARLTGTQSGDTYTLTNIEKISFKEWADGTVYAKSGQIHFSAHRNGKFHALSHVNVHITYNAKGETVAYVDHWIECDW